MEKQTVPAKIFTSFDELARIQTEYKGKLSQQQREGNKHKGKRYMSYEQDGFSKYQNLLYKRALFGLSAYPVDEIKAMGWEKKKRIKKVNARAQDTLNAFKQAVTNAKVNRFFEEVFPGCNLTKQLQKDSLNEYDPEFKNTLSLKDLGITKQSVVDLFISEGILPRNFYEVKKLT